jgi:hypothetical protein
MSPEEGNKNIREAGFRPFLRSTGLFIGILYDDLYIVEQLMRFQSTIDKTDRLYIFRTLKTIKRRSMEVTNETGFLGVNDLGSDVGLPETG